MANTKSIDVSSIHDQTSFAKYKERLEENGFPVFFSLSQIRRTFGIKRDEQEKYFGKNKRLLYRTRFISKRNGTLRRIDSPTQKLKSIQRFINKEILSKIYTNQCLTSFKKGTSIVDNAKPHTSKYCVASYDIKDYFPSIHYNRIFRIFYSVGYNVSVSHLLTKLCIGPNGCLPQGSPASPAISNIVGTHLDKRLSELCAKNNISYTRYADDLSFSANFDLKRYHSLINHIIKDEGFCPNEKKYKIRYSFQRQAVTGLIVNKKLSANKELSKEISSAIRFINKYGLNQHLEYIQCLDKDKYMHHLYGIAEYIKMVDLNKGLTLIRQLNRIFEKYDLPREIPSIS